MKNTWFLIAFIVFGFATVSASGQGSMEVFEAYAYEENSDEENCTNSSGTSYMSHSHQRVTEWRSPLAYSGDVMIYRHVTDSKYGPLSTQYRNGIAGERDTITFYQRTSNGARWGTKLYQQFGINGAVRSNQASNLSEEDYGWYANPWPAPAVGSSEILDTTGPECELHHIQAANIIYKAVNSTTSKYRVKWYVDGMEFDREDIASGQSLFKSINYIQHDNSLHSVSYEKTKR